MSKSPRALKDLMTAVDAGHAVDVYVDSSASSDSSRRKLLGPRHRRSTNYGRGGGGARKSAPAVAVVDASSSDASFDFGTAVNSHSSASPASMVFSDGQLRAHHFPAVRSSASVSTGSSQRSTSPLRSSSVGSSYSSTASKREQGGVTTGSKKRVTFATDGADKAAVMGKAGGGKKSGGLVGCMASVCGLSSRDEAVEPVARNDNRKVVAV